jgi:hypothetical protein
MYEREPSRRDKPSVVDAGANRYRHEPIVSRRVAVHRSPLVVGPADDPMEREADRIATDIVRTALAAPTADAPCRRAVTPTRIHRHSVATDRVAAPVSPAGRIRRSAVMGAEGGALDADTDRSVRAARSGGAAIEPGLRQRLDAAMGADFSGVRLHTDGRADALNRALSSRAFTTGPHIFFRRGELGTGDRSNELLAHELTHVVQQTGGSGRVIERKLVSKPRGTGPEPFNVIENRTAGTPHMDQGIASKPKNFKAPGFRVVVKNVKQQFTAKIVATSKANAGDNDAVFLAKGVHDSGYLWARDEDIYGGQPAAVRCVPPMRADRADDEHVLFNVSSAVATGSKAAEQEHIDDYHLAYDLTLGAAAKAVKEVGKRRFKAGKSSQAQAAATQALLAELQARSNGHLNSILEPDWEAEYKTLFTRSGTRDMNNWHIQDVVENPLPSAKMVNGWKFPVKVLDVQPGPAFRLNVSSSDVVDPSPTVVAQNQQLVVDDDSVVDDDD